MRTIKFRGKSKKNGKWAIGLSIIQTETLAEIYSEKRKIWVRVNPETVGQFTGLHDKDGKEIYEGDVVAYKDPDWDDKQAGYVVFLDGTFCLIDLDSYGRESREKIRIWNDGEKDHYSLELLAWDDSLEVIGNIHDTPSLLK